MKFSLIAIIVVLLSSCTSEIEKEEQALRKEIMDIHNEIMPKIDNIKDLKSKLQENKDHITSNNVPESMHMSELDSLIQALDNADKSMMVWMENYIQFNEDTFSHAQQMAYLHEEKEKIEAVKLKVLSTIIEAETVLGERP